MPNARAALASAPNTTRRSLRQFAARASSKIMSKHRSAIHGQYVTPEQAAASPDTTVRETVTSDAVETFIQKFVNDGIDEMTMGDLRMALLRSDKRYRGKGYLKQALQRQLEQLNK